MAVETVLVVEDEALLLDLITFEFEDAGLTVLQADTAELALDMIQRETSIDLLFTDIRLPGPMDGWELAEKARQIRPAMKIIYTTGYSLSAPRITAGSLFFTKPYRPSTILAAVRSLGSPSDGAGA